MYHISDDGEARPCSAGVRKCEFAKRGDPHFDSQTDALAYAYKLKVEEFGGVFGATTGLRSQRNSAILEKAFKTLDKTVAFQEATDSQGKPVVKAEGKELQYTIKLVPNGRAFVYYQKNGVDVRPSSWHTDVDEAKGAVAQFEKDW